MPGTRCTVALCNNSLVKMKKNPQTKDILYHKFPKHSELKKKWIHLCRRDGVWNPDTSSEHFVENDYIRDLKSELLNLPVK